MKPFLLISTRPEDVASASEYAQFLRYGGLEPNDLVQHRLEAEPLPSIRLEDYSGIMVGGSPFTGSDPQEFKSAVQVRVEREIAQLLDLLVSEDFPFLGACYGVGTLGRHQGGVIDETYSEPIGPATIRVTAEGSRDALLAGVPSMFTAYVGHKEACSLLPPHATLLASSEACPVQMFRVRANLYGTQFHPELDFPGICERITIYRRAGYFHPSEANEVIERCAGVDVSAAHIIIRNFVERYAR